MNEAERFLKERTNLVKVTESTTRSAGMESVGILPTSFRVLPGSTFSRHKFFWSIGVILLIILVNLLVMWVCICTSRSSVDCLSDLEDWPLPVIVSFLSPVTFWLPILFVVRWALGKTSVEVISWGIVVGVAIIHLVKIGILFRYVSGWEITIGIVAFLLGCLAIGAILWDLIDRKRSAVKPRVLNIPTVHERKYRIRLKCFACSRTFATEVATTGAVIVCPHCASEGPLIAQERTIKKPLVCKVNCVLFYLLAFSAIAEGIKGFSKSATSSAIVQFFLGMGVSCLFVLIASGIAKGMKWARILSAGVGVLMVFGVLLESKTWETYHVFIIFILVLLFAMFLPEGNEWFAVKTMIRKAHKAND